MVILLHGIGFESRSFFSVPNFVVYIDNKKNDVSVLSKGPTQVLEDTMITAAVEYSINFQDHRENFVYVFIIMDVTVFYLLMPQKCINL